MNRQERSAVAGVGLALVLLAGCHGDPGVRKQKYLESGNRYSAQGRYREAAIEYLNALESDANCPEAHHQLARTYLHLGQYSGAAAELARTVALQPTDQAARIEWGNLLLAGGRTSDAAAQARAVLAARPENADAHALLSAIAARAGKGEEALREMERAVAGEPGRAAFHEALALLAMKIPEKAPLAEAELNKSIALHPNSARPRMMLAEFYARNSRWQDAEQVSWNAIAVEPRSLAARKSLARILMKAGKQSYGEEVLRQASREFEQDPQGVRALADYYSASGQPEKAAIEFASLCAIHPADSGLRKAYARALIAGNDDRSAQPVVGELLKQDGDDPEVAALQGILLLRNGQAAAAQNTILEEAQRSPQDDFFQYWSGVAASARGEDALAEKSFRQAAALNPAALDAPRELARIAARRGDLELLLEVANRTLAAAPQHPEGYLWRAQVEMRRHRPAGAEADLRTALSLDPRNPLACLQFGKLRFAQHRFPEGVAWLEQCLHYDRDAVEAMRMLISYDLFRKRPRNARTRLATQMLLRPGNSGYFVLLAQLEMYDKRLDSAVAAAERAMQLDSGNAEAVLLYTQLQVRRGQTQHTLAAWQQWLKTHPGDAATLAMLGALEEACGNQAEAETLYREALRIEPRQPVAANNLAYRMLEDGENLDAALAYAQTARQAMQSSPHTADTLAWAYYCKGIYGFARELLEEAVKAEPDDVAIQYHLGMVYARLQQKNNAVNHLRKALSLAPDSPAGKRAQAALAALT